MADAVKHQRSYDSSRRREQAGQTRLIVLAAAEEMFLTRGYAQTTMAAVASEAGVSVETVYKAFGNKAGLVKTLFDVGVAGDDEPIPIVQREFVLRNIAEPDPRQKLIGYGTHLGEVSPRACPIQLVIREAAMTDPGAAEVWRQVEGERLMGMTEFARHMDTGGYLRKGVSMDEARDVLWTHNSVEVWDLLVNRRGWSNQRFGRWVGQQLVAALL